MQDINDQIKVYRLVSADNIVAQQDAIARAFFSMRSASDGKKTLTISPISGRLTYSDAGRIWQNRSSNSLPTTALEAQQVAEEFLRGARSRFNASQSRTKVDLSQLIPSQLSHVFTTAARNPGLTFIDHWLSIFAVALPTGISNPDGAPVDAKIELRMGPNYQPVGMSSTWRPFDSWQRVRHIAFPGAADSAQLFYHMADGEDPQTFLAPFYFTGTDDVGSFWPASSYSLFAGIEAQSTRSGIVLTAVTPDGVLGPFRYAWGAWRLDEPTAGFRMLVTGQQQINLTDVGSYNVVLDVQDQTTGAIARTQRVIFAARPQEQLVS